MTHISKEDRAARYVADVIDGRQVYQYPKPQSCGRSSYERWGVDKTRKLPAYREVLVLGTGRCGTEFTRRAFKAIGMDVMHEKMGEHGTVTQFFLVDSDWHPMVPYCAKQGKIHVGERASDFLFKNTFLIVRDPRKTIPSMMKRFSSLTWLFWMEHGYTDRHLSKLERAMTYWLRYNREAIKRADFVFKVEEYALAWPELMRRLKRDAEYPAHLRPSNRGTGYRKADPITWADMKAANPDLARDVIALANNLGYR